MSEHSIDSTERIADQRFRMAIDTISDRQLSPENINTYADEALEDLIEVITEVTESYDKQPTIPQENSREHENAAFTYYGLDASEIEQTLDHIGEVAQSTKRLDALVAKKRHHLKTVIVPPSASEVRISKGDGSFEKPKEIIPKLNTLMLLLEHGFDIDIEDEDEVIISGGEVQSDMMRSISYDIVEIPSLRRTVLVCDEVGNTTFVFDSKVCDEYGIESGFLIEQSKAELKDLINEDGRFGLSINYSKEYAKNLAYALSEGFHEQTIDESVEKVDLLKAKVEKVPEGYMSVKGMGLSYDLSTHRIAKAIQEVESLLGEVKQFSFGLVTTSGYSPEQQKIILEKVDRTEQPPADYLPIAKLAREFRASPDTVAKAINELGSTLGEVRSYRFGPNTTQAYSPDQQLIIKEHLGLAELSPEGFLPVAGMKDKYGFGYKKIESTIALVQHLLGEVHEYRFKGVTTAGYSPEQQKIILDKINEVEPAPNGYLSASDIANETKTAYESVIKAADKLGDALGETKIYRFSVHDTVGYSPKQVAMLIDQLDPKEIAPEGYLSVSRMSNEMGLSFATIERAIKKLGNSIGEVKLYRFGPQTATGYSPEQQYMILDYIKHNSKRAKLGEAALNFLGRENALSIQE